MALDLRFLEGRSGRETDRLKPKAALCLAGLTLIASDGTINDPESADIRKITRGDQEGFASAYTYFTSHSYEECINTVAFSLDEKQQITLIANLLDLAMADGTLANPEEKLISAYVMKFGLSAGVFSELCHYTSLKNDYSVFNE